MNPLRTKLPGTITFQAIHIQPNEPNYKPCISRDGTVNDTPFLDKLHLKIGARVMLTYNIDTSDGLTNGSTGVILDFMKTQDITQFIIVQFDDEETGESLRRKSRHIVSRYSNEYATPIGKVSFEYSLGKSSKSHTAKAKVIQFPLMLSWATTAHKFQGQTVKKPNLLVADIDSVFEAGQAYVILGRVQELQQLYLKSFTPSKIMVNPKAMKESENLSEIALNNKTTVWTKRDALSLKISTLNIRSVVKHFDDLKHDHQMLHSDIICLNETFLHSNQCLPHLQEYHVLYASKGRASGVAILYKPFLKIKNSIIVTKDTFQAVKISFILFDLIAVYRSPSETSLKAFLDILKNGIDDTRATIICGDMNINLFKNPSNMVTLYLQSQGFKQIVRKATHISGSLLDHVYIRLPKCTVFHNLHHVYYSDHDAILTMLRRTL